MIFMSKSLIEEFNYNKVNNEYQNVADYEVFKDKNLLDDLRKKIIINILDSDTQKVNNNEYIMSEVTKVIEGYNLSALERNHLYNLIDDEINGFGPITELLNDRNITEIMVNGPKDVYVEIDGVIEKDDSISFINDAHIIRIIKRLIENGGRTIDSKNPMVDSHLKDGSRINAVLPPLSVKGPVFTIRKFKNDLSNVEDLIRIGTLTPYMARFLEAAVIARLNILVSGGTGSGKTTLLNVLSSFIPTNERIITIEDAAELRLQKSHVITLETRKANYDENGEVTIRDLVRNSLRMRPDRIIVGETRGSEALDMLQAMNTGHDGSMSTLHANSPIDALNRLETMVLMSDVKLPLETIREYIASAINLVVHIERLSDGKRKITSISEITSVLDGKIKLNEIFAFNQNGVTNNNEVDGEFILYEKIPKTYKIISNKGIKLIDYIFKK